MTLSQRGASLAPIRLRRRLIGLGQKSRGIGTRSNRGWNGMFLSHITKSRYRIIQSYHNRNATGSSWSRSLSTMELLPSNTCTNIFSTNTIIDEHSISSTSLSNDGQSPRMLRQLAHTNQPMGNIYRRRYMARLYSSSSVFSRTHGPNRYTNKNRALGELASFHDDRYKYEDIIWKSLSLSSLLAKVPKGFENFIPKEKQSKQDEDSPKEGKDDNEKDMDKGSSSSPEINPSDLKGAFRNFTKGNQEKNDNSNSNNKNNKNEPPKSNTGTIAAIIVTLIFLALSRIDDDSDSVSEFGGREITWNDFRNYMLETGDVEKIVVTNKNATARVFLKPGAKGVPLHATRNGRRYLMSKNNNNKNMGNNNVRNSSSMYGDSFEDDTVMDMGSTTMTSSDQNTPASSSIPLSRGPPILNQAQPHQLVYRFDIGSVESFEKKLDETQREMGIQPRDFVPVQYTSDTSLSNEIISILPSLLLVGILFATMRGMSNGMGAGGGGPGGMFQMGKSNAKKIQKEDINVTFKDVAGCQEAKKEIVEFVDFLKDSSKFTKLGAKIPKGALLCGPPGTGKTLLAKAVAGEAGVPFFSISGSDFIEMFVGVGPSRVRDLFKEARSSTPCIVFIDEIDAIGRKRGRGGVGGNDERENTLNQLLVEMDGFNPSDGVVVLAGTNRVDILDDALTRPGRFDRQITVDKPDIRGRKEIFMVHLANLTLKEDAETFAGRLAGLTPGFAGADIANVCNEAAIVAARRKGDHVTIEDFEKATDRIVGGLESNKIMSDEEKRIVAHHEAGHAVAGWFLEHADPLLKVTIIPRSSGALGYAQYLPKEISLRTQDQIMDIICMALAGRAAEETFFGDVTTGASDDLRRVTQMVYSMIQLYGMNEKVGQLAFPKDPNAFFDEKPYSDATAKKMDKEAKEIVDAAYSRTLEMIRDKRTQVEMVANMLLEKETITHDDVYDSIGPRPFEGDESYKQYVSQRFQHKNENDDKDGEIDNEEGNSNTTNTPPTPNLNPV